MNGLLLVMMSYLLNPKIGPGEYRVHNDPDQVRRYDNGFVNKGIYDLKNGVRFRIWTRSRSTSITVKNPYLAQEIEVWNPQSLFSTNFDSRRLTKVFLHGANHRSNEKRLDKESAYIRDAYLTFADVNFILMDWTWLASHFQYGTNNGEIAIERLTHFLRFLNNHGTPFGAMHLLGHSWGAHVAGGAGKKLGGQIGRITGMDPAGPFYGVPFNYNPKRRLDKGDAQFVDVLHVDGGNFLVGAHLGIKEPIGHIDFYPAGGTNQPSCPPKTIRTAKDFYCSHEKGMFYFAESILAPFLFPSCKCESWQKFSRNQCACTGDDIAFLGEHCPKSKRGTYFLNVRKEEPYGLGPQTRVMLKSITGVPTIVETETRSPVGRSQNETLLFDIPTYSSRYTKFYKDDVVKVLLSRIANYKFR